MDIGSIAPALPRTSTDIPPGGAAAALIAKLSRYLVISADERRFVTALGSQATRIPRRRDVVREGHFYGRVNILCCGMVARYRVLPDGRRQVLNFGVPGDLIGFPSCLFERAIASVCCMTDVVVAPVPLETLSDLFARFPRLGTALFWAAARDMAICTERLVALGRRGADERVAYLVLELIALRGVVPRNGDRFCFPITQELIADSVGLSTPHVNRTLRKLREDGLLQVEGQEFIVHDAEELILLAGFNPSYLMATPIPGL